MYCLGALLNHIMLDALIDWAVLPGVSQKTLVCLSTQLVSTVGKPSDCWGRDVLGVESDTNVIFVTTKV